MSETTRLEDDAMQLDGSIDAVSHQGMLYLEQDEIGSVKLSPHAQFELLEWLYKRRRELYRATHLSIGDEPAWIQAEPTNVIESSLSEQHYSLLENNGDGTYDCKDCGGTHPMSITTCPVVRRIRNGNQSELE